jgi:capsule biosynthesis phosphatase
MSLKDKSICFDLDDTICFPNHNFDDTRRKYDAAKPNEKLIEAMRELRKKGFYITILSARRMLTHNGDIAKIIEDVESVTRDWLKRHDVPYDRLVFGKPYSSTWYVDDKSLTPGQFISWVKTI